MRSFHTICLLRTSSRETTNKIGNGTGNMDTLVEISYVAL